MGRENMTKAAEDLTQRRGIATPTSIRSQAPSFLLKMASIGNKIKIKAKA
ncbi:MAG: hypothetical protein J0L69_15545 [Bacteroidetes bacterium]|nr:hypothetical protein [Bacteroidota bacterium]